MRTQVAAMLLIGLFIIAGCGTTETTKPVEVPNTPPVIDKLIIPSEVEAGTKIALQVSKHDADGDQLTVNWEIGVGSLNKFSEEWTAPDHATNVRITVFVSDGINETVSASKDVKVIVPPAKTPPPSPPPTVTTPQQPPTVVTTPQQPPTIITTPQQPPTIITTPQQPPTVITIPALPPPTPERQENRPVIPPAPQEEARVVPGQGFIVITPGQDAVAVRIGDTFGNLRVLYGVPEVLDRDMFVWWSQRLGEFGCMFFNNQVVFILTTERKYRTAQGNGVGSNRHEIWREFGLPQERIDAHFEWYTNVGIAFVYDLNFQVEGVAVFTRTFLRDKANQ